MAKVWRREGRLEIPDYRSVGGGVVVRSIYTANSYRVAKHDGFPWFFYHIQSLLDLRNASFTFNPLGIQAGLFGWEFQVIREICEEEIVFVELVNSEEVGYYEGLV